LERIRSTFEPQSIYDIVLRPLHHPKIAYLDQAINQLIKNIDGDQQSEESPELKDLNEERFFTRRKLEFDLLRSHIAVVLNSRNKVVKRQNLNLIQIPPSHLFSDMRNFSLEPEKIVDVDYFFSPSFEPKSMTTGRGVRSSFNHFPKPYVAHGDSSLNIVIDSDRDQFDSPGNSDPLSPDDFKVLVQPISDMKSGQKLPDKDIKVLSPQNHPSAYQKNSEMDMNIEFERDNSMLDLKNSPETGRPNDLTDGSPKKKGPYTQALQGSNKASMSYLHLLRSYIRDNNSQIKLEDPESDCSLNLSNLDFDRFMVRLLGASRDYNYQNWNHFSKRGQLKFNNIVRKQKKMLSEMDFTETERDWKSYADGIPVKKLARSACLEYQYDPEYCFNSMIDVIDITKLVANSDPRFKTFDKPKSMLYNPRVFNDPHDSLYQESEFPFVSKKSKHALHSLRLYETDFPDVHANERSQRVRKMKREMYKTSKSLIKKDFLPIKQKDSMLFNISTYQENSFDQYSLKVPQFVSRRPTQKEGVKNIVGVSDKFLVDFVEIDVKHSDKGGSTQSPKRKPESDSSVESDPSSDLEPEEWYEGIVNSEKQQDEINQLNWSGEQVKITSGFSRHKVEVTIDSLNFQDLDIWLRGWNGFHRTIRKYLRVLMNHRYMVRFLLICVIANTVILTLDGLVDDEAYKLLQNFNTFFTVVFWISFLFSLWGHGWGYLRSNFNVFDGIIVIVSGVELAINFSQDNGENGGSAISAFRALRILRVFRVLRVTRILRSLKFIIVIITVITETVEQYLYIAIMLLLFLLIYALLGMQLYGGKLPAQIILPRANFDTFTNAFLTVLQLVTFENWTDHVVLLYNTTVSSWITLIFIVSWLILGNYVFLNLFLALLLGGFESQEVIKSLQETVDEFKELKAQIKKQNLKMSSLVDELEEKRVRESRNINYIINTDLKQQIYEEEAMFDVLSEEKLKTRGIYYLERGFKHDESSLEDLLYQTLEESTNKLHLEKRATMKKREIYLDVYCTFSLYVFPKKHVLRKFAASVVSHSW
jgi:hypothetical protein